MPPSPIPLPPLSLKSLPNYGAPNLLTAISPWTTVMTLTNLYFSLKNLEKQSASRPPLSPIPVPTYISGINPATLLSLPRILSLRPMLTPLPDLPLYLSLKIIGTVFTLKASKIPSLASNLLSILAPPHLSVAKSPITALTRVQLLWNKLKSSSTTVGFDPALAHGAPLSFLLLNPTRNMSPIF